MIRGEFSVPDVKVRNAAGELQFADEYGLTAIQLGVTMVGLMEARQGSSISENDIPGYHYVHHGTDQEVVEAAIETVREGKASFGGDFGDAEAFQRAFNSVSSITTRAAFVQRIRLGSFEHFDDVKLSPASERYFDVRDETDHQDRNVLSLYPSGNGELLYGGRVVTPVGRTEIGRFVGDTQVISDLLHWKSGGGTLDRTVVVSSLQHGHRTTVQAVDILTS